MKDNVFVKKRKERSVNKTANGGLSSAPLPMFWNGDYLG